MKRAHLFNCLTLLLLLIPCAARADVTESTYPDPLFPSGFMLAGQVEHFTYKEPDLGVTMKGNTPGAKLEFLYRDQSRLVLGFELGFTAGDADYDGGLRNLQTGSVTPVSTDTENLFLNTRLTAGFDWVPYENLRVTPFLGLGYRRWTNDIQGQGGYNRKIQYLYSPVGVEAALRLMPRLAVGARAEYDFFWRGWADSELGDVNPDLPTVTNNQNAGSGQGFRVSGFADLALTESVTLVVEPFFQYWKVDASEDELVPLGNNSFLVITEPDNKTTSYGVIIGLRF